MADDEKQIHIETEDARGATKSHMTRYILGISLVLVIVIFAVLLLARQ